MKRTDRELLSRLAIGPSFLVAGQAITASIDDADPVLARALAAVGVLTKTPSYQELLRLDPEHRTRAFDALRDAALQTETPEGLRTIADFPWNGVYSSVLDDRITRAFEAAWRRVVTVVGRDVRPTNPRSATDLKIRLLFGGLSRPEDEQPPTDRLELVARLGTTREHLAELAETLVTPRGVVVVDGYRSSDWLSTEELFSFASRLLPSQMHFFSADEETLSDEFIHAAQERGLLVPHAESLAEFLADAESTGRLTRPPLAGGTEDRIVFHGEQAVAVPRDVWNRIIGTARPIDESLLRRPDPRSGALRFDRFREFLDSPEGPSFWEGIAANYNFRRDFEGSLWDLTLEGLKSGEFQSPLILEGQAGSGKSVALASLAFRLADEREAAVLYISPRPDRPNQAALDSYALWADENGATNVVIVWDGSVDTEDYHTIHRYLRSRGRRVLIVGTSYLTEVSRKESRLIAPAQLSQAELSRVRVWLAQFGVDLRESDFAAVAADPSFLSALYRLLPSSRRAIQKGLVLELRTAENRMEARGMGLDSLSDESEGILAAALRRAGLSQPFFADGNESVDRLQRSFEERATIEQLTGLVLVAGRHGLRIPLELVMRVLGRSGSGELVEILRSVDIVRWSEDESGEQYLGTRNTLEGSILSRSEFSDGRSEAEVIAHILSEIRPRPGSGGQEVQFAVDLLNRVGPESDESARFRDHFLTFSRALRSNRVDSGSAHPRLMLMEANLAREFAKRLDQSDDSRRDERLAIFGETESVLEKALELSPPGRAKLNLLVELASTLGSVVFEMSHEEYRDDGLLSLVERIVATTREARSIDPESYYPVDVTAWVCLRVCGKDMLSDTLRASLIADTLASFYSLDTSLLSPRQRAKFDSRASQVATLLSDDALAEVHLERLAENEDPTAFYLLGLKESGLLTDSWNKDRGAKALERLLSGPGSVMQDWRCVRLILDLFWLDLAGHHFLRGEREVLSFSEADWNSCLDLAERLTLDADIDRLRVDFLRGLALFHLRQFRRAKEVFDDLDRASANVGRRIISTYLASSETGSAIEYSGQIRRVSADQRRGWAWVDELGIEVPFIPYRFGMDAPSKGDPLPSFHIAFNYRGYYADPIRIAASADRPVGRVVSL